MMENFEHNEGNALPRQPSVQEKKPGASIVPPILSVVFCVLAFATYLLGRHMLEYLAVLYEVPHTVATLAIAISRLIFCIPALILGIIGLVKNIRARRLLGILFAAVGLLLGLYLVIDTTLGIINSASYIF